MELSMRFKLIFPVLLIALATSCKSIPSPFFLTAEPTEIAAMAGDWDGEYFSPSTGRAGSIHIKITAGTDTAEGDVVMIPRGTTTPLRPAEMSERQLSRSLAEVLTIRFAKIDHGRVSGTLTTYRDPECGCAMYTTFTGRMTDDETMEGTFVATSPDLRTPQRGSWKVMRKRTARGR
jgi:hypothetical protein